MTGSASGGGDPLTAWQEMRERAGPRISLIRLYALVAAPRGLKPNELPLAERQELAARAVPFLWPGFQQAGDWERLHLLIRDYLRASANARDAYVAAKREAATLWADQAAAYTEAKSDVILGILDQAEAWAGATGWVI
jgi:hypothetical protein